MIDIYSKISFIFLVLFIQTFAAFITPVSGADVPEKDLVIGLLPKMNIFKQRERFEHSAP
jgi:hypothetical protein